MLTESCPVRRSGEAGSTQASAPAWLQDGQERGVARSACVWARVWAAWCGVAQRRVLALLSIPSPAPAPAPAAARLGSARLARRSRRVATLLAQVPTERLASPARLPPPPPGSARGCWEGEHVYGTTSGGSGEGAGGVQEGGSCRPVGDEGASTHPFICGNFTPFPPPAPQPFWVKSRNSGSPVSACSGAAGEKYAQRGGQGEESHTNPTLQLTSSDVIRT